MPIAIAVSIFIILLAIIVIAVVLILICKWHSKLGSRTTVVPAKKEEQEMPYKGVGTVAMPNPNYMDLDATTHWKSVRKNSSEQNNIDELYMI